LLEGSRDFVVPGVVETLTRKNILAMDFLPGEAIDGLVPASPTVRDGVVTSLLDLLFRELFEFRTIQTDPNFANFLYDTKTGRLGLLDFGATRSYPAPMVHAYRGLLQASLHEDRVAMTESARAIGYFRDGIHARQRAAVIQLFLLATEPARNRGCFDFGSSDLAARIRDAGMALSFEQGYWHTPPPDAVFLHRKLGGLYLLAARLRARVDVRTILERHLHDTGDRPALTTPLADADPRTCLTPASEGHP
jgi:hypothetical protein